ncbi:hypothetical protein Cgig2_028758 [Carnegiea gigantea]|uniref:Uncharacterized protein n=1 Tax=Carnegiea gigantea TaxID=171969 RepID=A0A9Q1JQJ8_9CARY|nr:hypothetical protein Cgig2_028758 [Carnegiea gigantea]
MAMQFAHTTHVLEMVQAISYTVVINYVAKVRLSRRDAMGCMMADPQELRWDIAEAWLLSIDERLRDTQVPRLVKVVYNPQPRPEATRGNPFSAPISPKSVAEAASTSTSSSLRETSSSSSDGSSRHSSSEGASTSPSSHKGPSTPGNLVLKRKGRSLVGPIPEIVAEGPEFPGAPTRSNPQDGSGSHFRNPKVVPTLKRTTLEKEYLLPARYAFVIPEPDAIGSIPYWNEGKPIKNPFREPTAEEKKTARYFHYYVREDDKPRPIPKFMV